VCCVQAGSGASLGNKANTTDNGSQTGLEGTAMPDSAQTPPARVCYPPQDQSAGGKAVHQCGDSPVGGSKPGAGTTNAGLMNNAG
jgi:hypothetical protein